MWRAAEKQRRQETFDNSERNNVEHCVLFGCFRFVGFTEQACDGALSRASSPSSATCGTPESTETIVDGRQCCAVRAPCDGVWGGWEAKNRRDPRSTVPQAKSGIWCDVNGATTCAPHKTERKLHGSKTSKPPLPEPVDLTSRHSGLSLSLYNLLSLLPGRRKQNNNHPRVVGGVLSLVTSCVVYITF